MDVAVPGTGDGRTVMVSCVARAVRRASLAVQPFALMALALVVEGFRWRP
jgi:hypothetical protein